VRVYVDSSVLLRVVLGEPDVLPEWRAITDPMSSDLIRLECLRTIDRARLRLGLEDEEVARHRREILEAIDAIALVPVEPVVLERAADPFPTLIGSLDAIHLATAVLARREHPDLSLATHDHELGRAARSMGFTVHGLASARGPKSR
jgi:predicted nucleic acid-binding protein